MSSFFDKLFFFNGKDYLRELETLYEVLSLLEDARYVYQTKFSEEHKIINRQNSTDCSLFFSNFLNNLSLKHKISNYGINELAIGIIQLWFKVNPKQTDPDFFLINLHNNL